MTPFARGIMAVLAISAVTTVQYASAQQAFVSDISPASYQAAAPRQARHQGYYGLEQTQMEAEAIQPKRVEAAQEAWSDSGDGASGYVGGYGCGNGCGSACGNCCNTCRTSGGCYAGAAIVWAKPFFQHNTAITSIESETNGSSDNDAEALPFEYSYEATPRVWLGYENSCGLGVRGRYWQFDHQARDINFTDDGTTSASVFLPALEAFDLDPFVTEVGDTLTANSNLKLQVADLEATQRFKKCRTDLVGSFGARYARVEQQFNTLILDENSGLVADLDQEQDFEGVGLTAALDARRKLGCTNLALVGGVRGSILFGQRNVLSSVEFVPDNSEEDEFNRTENEVLAIGEIMGGLEWSYCCVTGGRFYAQGIAEGQIWQGAGNATDSDSNLGFLGFGLAVGFAR